MPFSIRIEKEAHVFLCDGRIPPESNCYWFMLDAFDGRASAVLKCIKNAPRYIQDNTCQDERFRVNVWFYWEFLNSDE